MEGYSVAHGGGDVDLTELPMRQFCSFIWWFATRNAEKQEDVDKFDIDLWRPPKGFAGKIEGPWSPEAENEALMAFKRTVSGT